MQQPGDLAVTRQGRFVVTQNQQFQVRFNLLKGTWNYIDQAEQIIIRNAYAKVTLKGGTVLTTLDDGVREFITDPLTEDEFGVYQPVRFSHESEARGIRTNLYLNCYSKAPYIILAVGVENLGDRPVAVEQITLIGISDQNRDSQGRVHLGGEPSDYHLFLNMNPSFVSGVQEIYDGFESPPQACYDGVLYDKSSEKAFVFGFLSFQKWWSSIEVGYNSPNSSNNRSENRGINQWSLYHRCEQHLCRPGEEMRTETAYLNFSEQATASYQTYTKMLAKRMTARELEHVFSGWSAYPNDEQTLLGEKYIVEQVEQLVQNPLFYPPSPGGMEYIQLESGWQSAGSHEINPQGFPNGMKWVVEQIHAKGLKAGIRSDPFCVAAESGLVRRHPEFFLKDNRNRPATVILPGGASEIAVLDVSHPGAQAYIRNHLRQLVDEWGVDLVKTDLLSYTIGPMAELDRFRWHDRSLSVVELYQLGIKLLNETIQESQRDVILSACQTGSGPSIGGFSLNRPISSNRGYLGEALWEERAGLKQVIAAYAPYLSMHGTLWTNEFGSVAVNEPRPINEVLVALTAAALSGGVVTCADELTTLKPSRAELLASLFPLIGRAATPVDVFQNKLPQVWSLPVEAAYDAWNVVGVFNWKDQVDDAEFALDTLGLEPSTYYLVHDFWNRQFLGTARGRVTLVNMQPRSAKLLCFRKETQNPQLLATDIHFTQGGVEVLSAGWDERSQSFLVVCQPPKYSKGTLFIHVPEEYLPSGLACYGAKYQFSWKQPIYELTLHPTTDLVNASIQFSKTSG
jgi:hypothetical protein